MSPRRAEIWFRVACVVLALEQIGIFAFGWWLRGYDPPPEIADQAQTLHSGGTLLMVMAIATAAMNLVLACGARRPWLWVAGLTNLAAAVLCCPPAGLLLFVWMRPDVKRHFGMPE